jgi:hypothetical protein
LQLLQPFFGLTLSAVLLHEAVAWPMIAVTVGVILCVAGAKHFAKSDGKGVALIAEAEASPRS